MENLPGVEHQKLKQLINGNINHSIRTVMDMDKFDSVKAFYEYLKMLPFKDNMKLLQGKFMWKLVNAVHPNFIFEKFPLTYREAIIIKKTCNTILTRG